MKDTEIEDPIRCGALREYFEYDRNYPDDERICNEVLDLQVSWALSYVKSFHDLHLTHAMYSWFQCHIDFSNLDGKLCLLLLFLITATAPSH